MLTFAQKPKAVQQTKIAKSTKPSRRRPLSGQSHDVHSMLQLQRTIKHQAVQRLLQSNTEELQVGSATTASTRFGNDFSRMPIFSPSPVQIQPKLTVSNPGDVYEQEADRVADQVMRMPEPQLQHACPCGGGCPKCQMEQQSQEHEHLQTKHVQASGPGGIPVSPIVQEVLASPGRPLDASTRTFFESRFGHDFSHVRVHTEARAAESAQAINALAFTVGQHAVFGTRQYRPETRAGMHLLAHELAHVVQQGRYGTFEPRRIFRRVVPARVSCQPYPRTYPIFQAIHTDDPVGMITEADARAIELLDNTIGELSHIRARVRAGEPLGWPLIADVISFGMRRLLRLDPGDAAVWTRRGPGTAEHAIRWYWNIRKLLQSGWLRYICLSPTCISSSDANAVPGTTTIRLCQGFWDPDTSSTDDQAMTLIHETAHLYYGLRDRGRGMGNAWCLEEFVGYANGIRLRGSWCVRS